MRQVRETLVGARAGPGRNPEHGSIAAAESSHQGGALAAVAREDLGVLGELEDGKIERLFPDDAELGGAQILDAGYGDASLGGAEAEGFG